MSKAKTVKMKQPSEVDIKSNGVTFAVKIGSKHKGNFILTKTSLIWCKGKTAKSNGKKLSWENFIDMMER